VVWFLGTAGAETFDERVGDPAGAVSPFGFVDVVAWVAVDVGGAHFV